MEHHRIHELHAKTVLGTEDGHSGYRSVEFPADGAPHMRRHEDTWLWGCTTECRCMGLETSSYIAYLILCKARLGLSNGINLASVRGRLIQASREQ